MTLTDDIVALRERDLAEPHRILGAHPVRRRRGRPRLPPGRRRASRRRSRAAPTSSLERVDDAGLFAGELPGGAAAAALPARGRATRTAPTRCATRTRSCRRWATWTSTSLGEGRHEELYEKLGAHVRTLDGVAGTAFAVWAPAARSVSVVGDFNSWDGRLHPMRSLGSSGIWELFVPDVGEGQRYKFEVRTGSGELSLKADPLAFETEVPPLTASVVHEPHHAWGDDRVDGRAREHRPARPRRSRSTRCTRAPGG